MTLPAQHAIDSLRPLARYLRDPEVCEIMVNGSRHVGVERYGQHPVEVDERLTEMQLSTFLAHVSTLNRRQVDVQSGDGIGSLIVSAILPLPEDKLRIEAQLAPIAIGGPYLSIRRLRTKTIPLAEYVRAGSLDAAAAAYLEQCIAHRRTMLLIGGTSSGKTTLLNSLIQLVPDHERLGIIETVPELIADQWQTVRLEALEDRGYDSGVLLRSLLRSRPDRLVLGELRGGEAYDWLNGANTGHDGSLATIHANSPAEGLRRLENLVLEGRPEMPLPSIRDRVASTVQVLVHLARWSEGDRAVRGVRCIESLHGLDDQGKYVLETNYQR